MDCPDTQSPAPSIMIPKLLTSKAAGIRKFKSAAPPMFISKKKAPPKPTSPSTHCHVLRKGNSLKAETGMSIVELMIASTLGLIAVAAMIRLYSGTINSSITTLQSSRLNYDIDSALTLISNELRRAGYSGGVIQNEYAIANEFTRPASNIEIIDAGSGIIYSYDENHDGIWNNLDEAFGFRLNGSTLQICLGVKETDPPPPDDANCGDLPLAAWEALTITDGSEEVAITELLFSLDAINDPPLSGQSKCLDKDNDSAHASACADASLATGTTAVEARVVNVVINARLVDNPEITKQLTNSVRVRNDRVFIQP